MRAQSNARDVIRAVVEADHGSVEGSIDIVCEKYAGDEAALAVAFDDPNGVPRRGVLSLRRNSDETWRPSGGFMASARPAGEQDVWMTWGGWGGDSREMTVLGGWVADPVAVLARATDPITGRTMEEVVENGVALFMYAGDFGTRYARLELLDADGRVIRSGPLNRRP
jgi:hypothetical protein